MARRHVAACFLLLLAGAVFAVLLLRSSNEVAPARLHAAVAVGGPLAAANHLQHAGGGRERATLAAVEPVRQGSRRGRAVALTFDDGPSAYTRAIVRILRHGHARATFFPIGNLLTSHPGALRSEHRAGFVIGDHTVNHARLRGMRPLGQLHEIRGQARRLLAQRLPWPRLMRPPYGVYDRHTLEIAQELGMRVVMWSVDSHDYRRPGRKAIVRNVLRAVRPGAIVLMHDGGGPRRQTVAALPRIIRQLHRRGYRLVTVPQLLARR